MELAYRIITDFSLLNDCLKNEAAKKYLRFGFNIRALQIKETVFKLSEIIEKAGEENINTYDICHVNIYLNSFYLNVLGALDNLAWVLQHEFSVIEGANENNKKRNSVFLFGAKFQESLKNLDTEFVFSIEKYRKWFNDLKEFRDPAAHRMPLYCPPGVISAINEEQHQKAYRKYKKQNYHDDRDSYMNAMHDLINIGEFQPIFNCFSESNNEDRIYPLLRTVKNDYTPFWKVSSMVCDLIKRLLLLKLLNL